MAYNHGVKVSEKPTSILPPVSVSAGIPFVVGTAPVNMSDVSNVNKPVLCSSYAEAVVAFGYVPPVANDASGLKKYEYSISQFIYSQFALFGASPVIIVNVLDPVTHKKASNVTAVTLDADGSAVVPESGIIRSSISLGGGGSGSAYVEGEDYAAAFDDDGYLVITALKNTDGTYKIPTGTAIEFSAQRLNPAAVDANDIIGGVDVSGNKSGFELVDECFPRFRLVPGLLLAPGYSGNAALAAVMAAKAANINQEFTAVALIDVPTASVAKYSDVAEWKNTNSITDPRQIVCWPGVSLDGVYYDLSVQLAGAIAITDSENDDVPYVSPSNHAINATASVLASGEEVWIAPDTGAYLNGQGVVTALNFIGGWVAWGNRTACYPANTDVKDSFIPVKRMFAWVGNTIIQTYWSKVDAPLNRRLIDTILDSVNLWLNGLAARQYIIGGRVEFNPDENPSPDLLDGIARFHVYITPASPARELDFILEYDPAYLANLFS
jgi:phage tail sheath protein FI